MKKLRQMFTSWYIKRGYTFRYSDVPVYTDGLITTPLKMPESIFNCPFWVRPLLIFFSPSYYFMRTWGKLIADGLWEGVNSVSPKEKREFDKFLVCGDTRFFVHIEKDESVASFDTEDLDEEYIDDPETSPDDY